VVKTVFGAPDPKKPLVLIDFGDLRVYPNNPQVSARHRWMMSAPELTRRARLLRPLTQLSLLVLITLALVWSVELIRHQDPFLRAVANLPPDLQGLELLLEQPHANPA
jgi:hypothetical protein